ncbi:hypothetical protein Q1695_004969 [Nippostrongylus brasiliensis]|nr:hypothetical protein Q1695_004969 [Nippostrongylus brasiliensis]
MFSDRALGRRYKNNIIEQVALLDIQFFVFLTSMGLPGLFPIQPKTIIKARYNREQVAKSAFGDSVETTEVVEVALRRTEYFCGCSRTC